MSPRVHSAMVGVIVLAISLGLIVWMADVVGRKIEPGTAERADGIVPPDARLVEVVRKVVPVVEEAAGTVAAERRTTVSSRILAAVEAIEVRAGDTVERGQLLVRLRDDDLRARVDEARRAVEAAQATRDHRANEFARARQLLAAGVVSQSEFDQAEEAARVAEAELERARQILRTAQINLTYAAIDSPVSGRVVDRLVDPGDTATPGRPLLSLYDPTALRIEVPVRESLIAHLQPGAPLKVHLASHPAPVEGVVDEIVPQAEAGSRTFLVKVGLPRREGIYTGTFGRVVIPTGERARLLIPRDAVERIGQLSFVTVVDSGRHKSRRLVTLGPMTEDGHYEVLSGLDEGERVLALDQKLR